MLVKYILFLYNIWELVREANELVFRKWSVLFLVAVALLLSGCGKKAQQEPAKQQQQAISVEVGLSSCCVTEDVMTAEILPAFQAYWEQKTGQKVEFVPTFAGSGTLTNQLSGGTPNQVAILSTELYALRLQEEGFTSTDWRQFQNRGAVAKSAVVLMTREGNPKNLRTFEDLTKKGVEVLHPSPDTSGGAQWAIFAVYGAGLARGEQYAKELLEGVERNVVAMPESAKQTVAQFEAGFGDVLVTYENEALLEKQKGSKIEIVVPESTIETEWTVVKLDKNITSPVQEAVVDAFIEFLFTRDVQSKLTGYGFRSIYDDLNKGNSTFAAIEKPFTVETLGGWTEARTKIIDTIWREIMSRI